MSRPRLFCELPAGLAAVSLQLQGGAHCRPPISRMGNKAGYAKVILGVLGLHSGQGAGAYWWAEADQDVAALLRIYPDPVALLEVARIIRGWSDEEPRALWERLRASRRERGSRSDPGGVAGWIVSGAWNYVQGDDRGPHRWAFVGFVGKRRGDAEQLSDRAARLAEYAMIAASNRLICVGGPDLMNTGDGGTRFGGEFATSPGSVAEGMERVAGWMVSADWAFERGNPNTGYAADRVTDARRPVTSHMTPEKNAAKIECLSARGWPPVRVSPSIPTATEVSAAIGTPGDLEGCIVYSDPPYINTTGYGHDLSRAAVVTMARDFSAMGATVAISEQTPIAELDGWESVEISDGRVGSKRTFSAQKNEWITMNRKPGFKIPTQCNLFGASE